MKEGFRQAMAWLHTWTGLIFGWLLFAIFLTGTLSYFKEEITHWTKPEIQSHPLNRAASLDLAQRYLQAHAAQSSTWFIRLPSEREAALSVGYREPEHSGRRGFNGQELDAASGQPVEGRDSRGGEFFYRFHFQLEMPHPWGRWLSTFCAFIMLLGLVTGIITHKKIFKEFFTFRPGKGQRSWLDGHNAIGVLVLPFHLMISYSSLVIFMYMVMPAGILASYGDTNSYFNDLFGRDESIERVGAAPQVPLSTLYHKVLEQAPGAQINLIRVENPGDASARVTLSRASADSVAYRRSANWTFNGADGALLSQGAVESAAMMTSFTFVGLHMGNFAGPWLRWLYFVFGVAGTAVIGTGPAQARQARASAARTAPGRGAQHRQHGRAAAWRGRVLLGQSAGAGGAGRPRRVGDQGLLRGLGTVAGACHAASRPACLGRAVGPGRGGVRPAAAAQRPHHRTGPEPFDRCGRLGHGRLRPHRPGHWAVPGLGGGEDVARAQACGQARGP